MNTESARGRRHIRNRRQLAPTIFGFAVTLAAGLLVMGGGARFEIICGLVIVSHRS